MEAPPCVAIRCANMDFQTKSCSPWTLVITPASAFAQKWQGAWKFTVRAGRFYNHGAGDWPSEVFSVTPAKVFAHAKGEPYGATTHRF